MKRLIHKFKQILLAVFIRIEKPAAWVLLIGALVVLVGLLVGFIVAGQFKWPAVLLVASLVVDGLGAVQQAEPELGDSGSEDEPQLETVGDYYKRNGCPCTWEQLHPDGRTWIMTEYDPDCPIHDESTT